MAQQNLDYQQLQSRLDAVLEQLQSPDVQLDEALKLYEEGLRLTQQLEAHIQQAQNTITTLSQKFGVEA